ncbi:MAG TPA: molybdate ABC transporter substrate-binding protein [Stellaceae bacterium]|jgi:molybdate transport system substrate-binding protein|nr:molybdate ABC transporter substrate-binding protein [Stellaceae bacterium]
MYRRIVLAGLACLLTLATAGTMRPAAAQSAKPVVFAAASLKNALDAVVAKWKTEGGSDATISYAASSTLAKQIEGGAPANMFISADLDWMDYLQKHDLIDVGSRLNLLGNNLVLIAPATSAKPISITQNFPLATVLGDGKLAMADPASVPAGKYGKAALTKLGVWASVEGKVAAAENVRAALLLVSRGEAPLGVVYQTDAAVEPGVKIVGTFPADSHPPIIYPMALIKNANPAAAKLAAFLQTPAAKTIFEAQGFSVLDKKQ